VADGVVAGGQDRLRLQAGPSRDPRIRCLVRHIGPERATFGEQSMFTGQVREEVVGKRLGVCDGLPGDHEHRLTAPAAESQEVVDGRSPAG
jgi:hypothetical protein